MPRSESPETIRGGDGVGNASPVQVQVLPYWRKPQSQVRFFPVHFAHQLPQKKIAKTTPVTKD